MGKQKEIPYDPERLLSGMLDNDINTWRNAIFPVQPEWLKHSNTYIQ
jgi:hypothetical protein